MKQKMTGTDVCLLMHTALRKCCDSKITSCLYNLVHLVDVKPEQFDPWRFYGQLVADLVNARIQPTTAVTTAHERFESRFLELIDKSDRDGQKPPTAAMRWMYSLSCAMECFDNGDWEDMASYLGDAS